jgi:hypothetical protein
MQEHNITPNNTTEQDKDTNIVCFLETVNHLQPLSDSLIERLAERFSVTLKLLKTLIEFSKKGGGISWN